MFQNKPANDPLMHALPPSHDPHNDYCSTRDAAERLGVSQRTVQLWVENGILEAWKTGGGHRRVSVAAVERLLHRYDAPAPPAPPFETRTRPARPLQPRLKVLVVDDEHLLLKLYTLRINAWNLPIEVVTCSNVFDALLLIGREAPDILITDIDMPGTDGLQMIRILAASPFRDGLEIVVVSALSPEEIELRGGIPARVLVLAKPVPFHSLRELCKQHLDLRSAL